MDYKFYYSVEDFVYYNGLGSHHSAKTIDKHLEDDDLMALVFFCKNTYESEEDLTEENVEDILIDFVNCIGDDFGWKYGTCCGWYDTIENIIELVKNNNN